MEYPYFLVLKSGSDDVFMGRRMEEQNVFRVEIEETIPTNYRSKNVLFTSFGRHEVKAVPPHHIEYRQIGDSLEMERNKIMDWLGYVITKIRMENGLKSK